MALSVPTDMTTELVLTGGTWLLLLAVVLGTVTILVAEVAVADVVLLVIVLGPVVGVAVVDALVVVELLLVLGTVVVCVGAGDGCTDGQLPEERGGGQVSATSVIMPLLFLPGMILK